MSQIIILFIRQIVGQDDFIVTIVHANTINSIQTINIMRS